MSPTKEEIELALNTDYEEASIASILADAYLEAVEALREYVQVDRCENPTREAISNPEGYLEKLVLYNCGECQYCRANKIIEKAPEGEMNE
jgi:hypothetical protein